MFNYIINKSPLFNKAELHVIYIYIIGGLKMRCFFLGGGGELKLGLEQEVDFINFVGF